MNKESKESLINKYSSKNSMNPQQKEFRPGPGPRGRQNMSGGKPKNIIPSLKRLFSYIGKDKYKIALVFFMVIITTVSTLGATYILRPLINSLVDNDTTKSEKLEGLLFGIIILLLVYLVGVVTNYLQQKIMLGVAQRALKLIRKDLFSKMQKLPVRYFDTNNHGELMSRYTNDVDTISELLTNTAVQLFSGLMSVIGTLVIMLYINWILTIITIIMIPILTKVGSLIAKKSRRYYKSQQVALGAVNSYIEETVSGQKVVKVFCHENKAKEEFAVLSEDLQQKQLNAQFYGGIMGPVMGNLSQVSYSITAATGGIMCLTKGFDIGGLSIFVQYARGFSRPINEMSMQINTIFSALAGAERVFEVMDEEPEKKLLKEENKPGIINGDVCINNVTFSYNPDKIILYNISVNVKKGQKIAFVGSTGAGKTTITNLLNRFYDVNEGQITIDGIDICSLDNAFLRKNIAMVLQDTHLFSTSVRENIRYGRLDATDEEVEQAAIAASAHSFIKRLKKGYDTLLEGDGSNLSQGQRQLINIARATISRAPILVLDEATSSVDTRTEKHIEHGMDRLMKNRTTFIIAHRLSTVKNADMIVVLEQGKIVEYGTHKELIENKDRYYQLYTGAVELD